MVETDKIILDGKIRGDVKADEIDTHSNSNITGNLSAKKSALGGKLKGNVNSESNKYKKKQPILKVCYTKKLYQLKKAQHSKLNLKRISNF